MNAVYYVKIEFDGRKWERETYIDLFETQEKAEAYLKQELEKAKEYINEFCDDVVVEDDTNTSFEVQGDEYLYWTTGMVGSQIPR